MKVEWYCQMMGSEVGPLTQDQLVDMVRQHRLTPEDLVRRNQSSWVPAFEVKGLFEAAAKPAPTPTPEPQPNEHDETPDVVATDPESPSPPQEVEVAVPVAKPKEDKVRRLDAGGDKADWYCIASGEKKGPVDFSLLQELAAEGKLRGRDRVWRGSWPKYQTAAEVDGLKPSS